MACCSDLGALKYSKTNDPMYNIGSTFRTATLSLLQSTRLHSCPSCPFHFVTMPPLPRWTTAKSPGSFPWSGSCRATSAGDSTRRSSGWRRRKRPRPTRRNRPTFGVSYGRSRALLRQTLLRPFVVSKTLWKAPTSRAERARA